MFALLVRILRRPDWAEEALQESFLKIWQKAETYSAVRGAPLNWLLTVARYRALDLIRRKRPELTESELAQAPAAVALDAAAADPGRASTLESCVQRLPPEQRAALLMAYYEGYSVSELARKLKTAPATAKQGLRRGLQTLQECLGQS